MARILMCSYSGYGVWFMMRLIEEGHSVDYYLDAPSEIRKKPNPIVDILKGLVPEPTLGNGKKENLPDFSKYDLVLFDLTGRETIADEALSATPTIGDGSVHKNLEEDRALALHIMMESGIAVPSFEEFDNPVDARRFIKLSSNKNKRYVFKPNGGQDQDTAATYVSKDAEDLLGFLDELSKQTHGQKFILQEFVKGTEVSCEAWFNGSDFSLINYTLEEKKLMNDGLGPATGCAGNVVKIVEDNANAGRLGNKLFREGVEKLKDFFSFGNYRGMIDLNSIVTDGVLYGIEFTPRFGYDAACTLFSLINSDLGNFLCNVAHGERDTYSVSSNFAGSIRLSIPPYPTEIPGKHPANIHIEGFPFDKETLAKQFYMYDVALEHSESGRVKYDKRGNPSFVTAGATGFITAPIAIGDSVINAMNSAKSLAERFHVPNLQYRTDLAERLDKRHRELAGMGWLR